MLVCSKLLVVSGGSCKGRLLADSLPVLQAIKGLLRTFAEHVIKERHSIYIQFTMDAVAGPSSAKGTYPQCLAPEWLQITIHQHDIIPGMTLWKDKSPEDQNAFLGSVLVMWGSDGKHISVWVTTCLPVGPSNRLVMS